jgi:hypothetical protein
VELFAISHTPIEVVIAARNHWVRLRPTPIVVPLPLVAAQDVVSPRKVIDHKQKTSVGSSIHELGD